VRIGGGEYERRRPIGARRLWAGPTGDARRARIELDIEAAARAAEDDAGMQRISGRHAAFAARPDRLPVALPDLGELAARSHCHGAAVLLRARDPVRESIVDRDVIDLRDRLIQPRTPLHLGNVVFAARWS